ncbi:MAG: hypothetical protein AB7V16_11345 [Vulcanibacillus sp.]
MDHLDNCFLCKSGVMEFRGYIDENFNYKHMVNVDVIDIDKFPDVLFKIYICSRCQKVVMIADECTLSRLKIKRMDEKCSSVC